MLVSEPEAGAQVLAQHLAGAGDRASRLRLSSPPGAGAVTPLPCRTHGPGHGRLLFPMRKGVLRAPCEAPPQPSSFSPWS